MDLIKKRNFLIQSRREGCSVIEFSVTMNKEHNFSDDLRAIEFVDNFGLSKVREAACLFQTIGYKNKKAEFILRSFPNGSGSWDDALAWARLEGLKLSDPCEILIAAERLNFSDISKVNSVYIVATKKCIFDKISQAVYVQVDGPAWNIDLGSVEDFQCGSIWFLFRK